MESFKRFEILLPLQHNDGSPVDATLVNQTWKELVARFQAVTVEPSPLRGVWNHEGREFEDTLIRIVVVTEDSPEVRAFFASFKDTLKVRFEQLDIWITAHPIEIL